MGATRSLPLKRSLKRGSRKAKRSTWSNGKDGVQDTQPGSQRRTFWILALFNNSLRKRPTEFKKAARTRGRNVGENRKLRKRRQENTTSPTATGNSEEKKEKSTTEEEEEKE